jgi:hypothetical protein
MKTLELSPNVEIALSALDPDGVRRIHAWFDYLRRWDEDEVVRANSIPLDTIPGVYMLRTTTDLRVFFRIDGDTVKVLDVARMAAILAFGGAQAPPHAEPQVK